MVKNRHLRLWCMTFFFGNPGLFSEFVCFLLTSPPRAIPIVALEEQKILSNGMSVATFLGLPSSVSSPCPSWPTSLAPHVHTEPSSNNIAACLVPMQKPTGDKISEILEIIDKKEKNYLRTNLVFEKTEFSLSNFIHIELYFLNGNYLINRFSPSA